VSLNPQLDQADDFLRNKYYPFLKRHAAELTDDMKQALWTFTANEFPLTSQAMTNLPRDFAWADVERELDENSDNKEFSVVRDFQRKQSIRSLDWLQEHGYCQDHIKPGESTLPQAGRGAFASRRLPKGTVVGYAPLVHIGLYGRDIFTVEIEEWQDDKKEETDEKRTQYDLIINYSFGHRNSTVLLTPYGAGVNYINHGGKEKANVAIRWPDKELVAHKPWFLKKTPEELANTIDKIGLSFEYVATRDIEEGDEVLMDYGKEWEEAWEKHVKNWKPVEDASLYVHSSEWEEDVFRTEEELKNDPYPPNLLTMCHESYSQGSDGEHTWVPVLRESPDRVYCTVLKRLKGKNGKNLKYTVKMEREEGEPIVVNDVPSDGIFLYDKAWSQDWHMPNVFRHEIMIPDEIMPEAWMNGPPPTSSD
jgi:hypothetical protein